MGINNLVNWIRLRWYIPVVAGVLGVLAHLALVTVSGPAVHRASARVTLDERLLEAHPRLQGVIDRAAALAESSRQELLTSVEEVLVGVRDPRSTRTTGSRPADLGRLLDEQRRARQDEAPGTARWKLPRSTPSISVLQEGEVAVETGATGDDESRLWAWLLGEALASRLEQEVLEVSAEILIDLQVQEEELEREWKSAIEERLEFSRGLGVVDLDRQEKLLQSLILEIDEEISRLEIERLELARWINDLQVAQATEEERETAREILHESSIDRLREELLQARLEFQVQSLTLTPRHPQMARLQRKILDLETRLEESSSAESETAGDDVAPVAVGTGSPSGQQELLGRYRLASLRLDTLNKKRKAHALELRSIAQVRPDHSRISSRVELARQRLEPVRASIANLEWFHEHSAELLRVVPPESAVRVEPRFAGTFWRGAWGLAGVCVGLLVVAFLGLFDSRLRSEQGVTAVLELPVLARIPVLPRAARNNPEALDGKAGRGNGALAREGFHTSATILRTVGRELGLKIFTVSSALPGEGKTTALIHLGVSLARRGLRVALVDANFSQPDLHRVLGLQNEVGLAGLLQSGMVCREVIQDGKSMEELVEISPENPGAVEPALQCAFYENLLVLPAGEFIEPPCVGLTGPPMRAVLDSLATTMDVVLVDTASLQETGEALELVGMSDASILVVGAGQCPAREARRARQMFDNVQTSVLGVILNRYRGEIEISTSLDVPARSRETREPVLSR